MIGTNSRNRDRSALGARALLFAWGPVLVWMGLIFYVSTQNTWTVVQGPPIIQAVRKSAHVFEYALLALLLGRALSAAWAAEDGAVTRDVMLRVWRVGTLLSGLYAASDEIHQSFVPKREFHLTDILIDTLSALGALGVWYIVCVERKRRRRGGGG